MSEFDTYTLWDFLNQDGGRRPSPPPSDDERITEDGETRITENDEIRIIE